MRKQGVPETESGKRSVEIQCIFNILEPNPALQPLFFDDEAIIFEATSHDESEIRKKLERYFEKKLEINFYQPLWRVVDAIKEQCPDWPYDNT